MDKMIHAGRHKGERVAIGNLLTVGKLIPGGGSGGGYEEGNPLPTPPPTGIIGLNSVVTYGENLQAAFPINHQVALGSNYQICVNPAGLRNDVAVGHYSVLIHIDDRDVILHDPFYGPSRRYSHAELLTLWQPRFPTCEITGNVLIAISAKPPAAASCQLCNNPVPSSVECPRCRKTVGLQPAAALGCMSRDCIGRLWDYICCPSCDYLWAVSLEPVALPGTGAQTKGGTTTPTEENRKRLGATIDVDRLFGAIDKFCAHILAAPAAASHPEIRKQLDHIAKSKETFQLAYAEQLARSSMFQEQFAAIAKNAQEQKEAHRQKMEELNKPSPPLDGDALGRALLKSLDLPKSG